MIFILWFLGENHVSYNENITVYLSLKVAKKFSIYQLKLENLLEL